MYHTTSLQFITLCKQILLYGYRLRLSGFGRGEGRDETMYDFDEDFYEEPSEFEMQVGELKQSLLKSVKTEFISEMERLRKENDELKTFKQQKQNIEREIANLKRQSAIDKEEAIRQAKRDRLSELLGGFEVEMWTPEYYLMDSRKCDRCNEKRQIRFTTPLGRESAENCTCSGKITVHHPAKNILHKISTRSSWGKIENVWLYYSLKNDGDYDSAERRSDDSAQNLYIHGTTTFEDVEKSFYRRFYFESYDDCHRYCMWKMQKEAGILPQAIDSTEQHSDSGSRIKKVGSSMKCIICSSTENVRNIKHLPYPEGRNGHVTLAEMTPYCNECAVQQGGLYAKQMDELLKSRQ